VIDIKPEDEAFLKASIRKGEVILVLGAGASATSINRADEPVRQSKALAKVIAERAGMPYADEPLTTVLSATLGRLLSQQQINALLRSEYAGVTPSPELAELFSYTWKRLYTWNIDDGIDNVKRGVQKRRTFNGLADKAADYEDLSFLHVVYLHGQVIKPEHGFILTEAEYNQRIALNNHEWYRRAAQDYISFVPVFVGTQLAEPILHLELERARPRPDAGMGRAYLVTPDEFSPLEIAALESKGVVHLKGTLADFVAWLGANVATKLTPIDIAEEVSSFAAELVKKHGITAADAETAKSIKIITYDEVRKDVERLSPDDISRRARTFLEGGPPTWVLSSTQVPVELEVTKALQKALAESIERRDRIFVVHGQSGSGKSTALMQCLLQLSREQPALPIYELRGDVKSLRAALLLIERLHPDEHAVVYVNDAFVFGDSLREDLLEPKEGRLTMVTSARSGEWREHLERRVGDVAATFAFQRFGRKDFQPLIDRLLEYVPAPWFQKLGAEDRLDRMGASRSQLLIALREATQSDSFTNVITAEYEGLSCRDSQIIVLMAGLATLARVGLSREIAIEAYARLGATRTFDDALRPLEGIVFEDPYGRLIARHELYVRHIIENVAPFRLVVDVIIELLRTYTKYDMPVIKKVNRYDGLLFKFLLNHNFVADVAKHRGEIYEGLRVYQDFEIDFQLDGHYWLQYGLYLVEAHHLDEALRVLQKSIQAYPDNPFAAHAYAYVQLRVARQRPQYDAVTTALIGDAVRVLLEQDASYNLRTDQYPIVTLANEHVAALIKHDLRKQAHEAAKQYFDRLQELAKHNPAQSIQDAKERLGHFLFTGEWADGRPLGRGGQRGPKGRKAAPAGRHGRRR
jgi:hypothetical protein